MFKFSKYKKIVRKYHRQLIKGVRKSGPWDYDAVTLFVTFLRFMQEYYRTGDNVWSEEIEGHNRLDILNRALYEYDGWQNNDSPNCRRLNELCENYDLFNENKSKTTLSISDEMRTLAIKVDEEEQEHWNNFWTIIKDEFLYLWD